MENHTVGGEVIEKFLQGSDPQKYIVAIEANYYEPKVQLIINDPEKGKRIETHGYQPFIWLKHDVSQAMYGGDKNRIRKAMRDNEVTITALNTKDGNGFEPKRMDDGYKYMAMTKRGYGSLLNFFSEGGVEVYKEPYRTSFLALKPDEQFMIQSGKRLFKGFDDYNDVHRFQFDLETEGLKPKVHAIFQIGMRDNRGFEHILETKGDTEQERRDSERANLKTFFGFISKLQPDIITGYNSESFDWDFIYERCERLSIDITKIAHTLSEKGKIRRREAVLKLGNESERYMQTYMWGTNILDISHAVRRAMAINSDIKKWGLKYITQFSEIAKDNRVYVDGAKLNTIWSDTENDYYFNNKNGDWYQYDETIEGHVQRANNPEFDYKKVTGAYIVQRYLMDDLWETEKVDEIYNQAGFLLGKWIPTNFQRVTTMGTAGIWQLLMCAWSYEQKLAIPTKVDKADFTGGLARLLEVGYAEDVDKLDYAALYPNIIITHGIYPEFDISGVMESMIVYIAETRDKYKALMNEAKAKGNTKLADYYDKAQLPIKILANSFFGAFGAPHIFPWGDVDCAEEITCRARQYLRLMVKNFFEGYGFRPLVGDTDGFNFARPKNVESIRYTPKGTHRMTKDDAGKELTSVEAVVAEFNELYMIGRMGLDIDDNCKSTINFARKNYANHIIKKNKQGGTYLKLKLVGNTVKSKVMPTYIEEFLDKAIIYLLDGDGKSFIEYYYDYVEKIYNYQIPITKIASKSKVNETPEHYKNVHIKGRTKAGQLNSRKAYMELVLKEGLNVDLGEQIFYINTGTAKSHPDVKKVTDKETGDVTVEFNCEYIPTSEVEREARVTKEIAEIEKEMEDILNLTPSEEEIEDNGDAHQMHMAELEDRIEELKSQLIIREYNVTKYIDALNKRLTRLFVCFHPDIRDKEVVNKKGDVKIENNIMINVYKDKETKLLKLEDRKYFTPKQCELVAGKPFDADKDQDSYEDLMTLDDKEFRFWIRVNKVPNNMEEEEWLRLKDEYLIRIERERIEGIAHQTKEIWSIIRKFESAELNKVLEEYKIPKTLNDIAEFTDSGMFVSKLYDIELCHLDDLFKYQKEAKLRGEFYLTLPKSVKKKDRFQAWIDHLAEQDIMEGSNDLSVSADTKTLEQAEVDLDEYDKERLESKVGPLTDEQRVEYDAHVYHEDYDRCQRKECGGCEHCDGMHSKGAMELEEKAHREHKLSIDNILNTKDDDDVFVF